MKTINFSCTTEDRVLIGKIITRYASMVPAKTFDKISLEMDLVACNNNACKLDFEAMLNGQEFDFMHDIVGLRRHLNRLTGELEDCFLPRFAFGENRV